MAAYAALLSVANVIDQLEHHPRPPISLHKQQVESLTENITFLQEFLEIHNGGDGARGLESRIADAAYAAEDIIELHILDEVLDGSTSRRSKISAADLYEGLQKVNEDMDSIKKEAKQVKQIPARKNSRPIASSRSARQQNTTMVGMDGALLEMMDMLVAGSSNRKVIPITGMGGIGKTTLALNLYRNETVVQHFHLLTWATISQEYTVKGILLQLLDDKPGEMDEYELGKKLHKRLTTKKYLIIIDDIWDIKIWEKLKLYFPDVKNGSRIVLTTRLSNLASLVSDSPGIAVAFLNEEQSWNLFCNTVFGKEDCPLELEKSGRKIVESCRGLPLSINVIGANLDMSAQAQQHWEYIAENMSSVVNLEGNEHCLEILYASYNSLPLHLKPCFLYMGIFKEDSKIPASSLIKVWVAEGFLKPSASKLLEEVAQECLTELVERNLISVNKRNFYGKVKSFRIHDLLRDLCIREARKEKFFYVPGVHCVDASRERRIWSPNEETQMKRKSGRVLGSLSVARSLIWKHEQPQLPRHGARLLRLYSTDYDPRRNTLMKHLLDVFKRVNLRYIDIREGEFGSDNTWKMPYSISLLWNLQTLVLPSFPLGAVISLEIWKLPQLRHVNICPVKIELSNHDDGFVLENLCSLRQVHNLCLGEEMVKRIPNIRKLWLFYSEGRGIRLNDFNLNYIGHLSNLSTLFIENYLPSLSSEIQTLTIPNSLKKLSLSGTGLPWELMTKMVGLLPLLEGLHLSNDACVGGEWITIENQFRSLKFLHIEVCYDLKYWETESSHFARLEHVCLYGISLEIPSSLGDISTLRSIKLSCCSRSTLDSLKRIREEQEELENLDLQFNLPSDEEYGVWDDEDEEKDDEDKVRDEDEDEDEEGEDEDKDADEDAEGEDEDEDVEGEDEDDDIDEDEDEDNEGEDEDKMCDEEDEIKECRTSRRDRARPTLSWRRMRRDAGRNGNRWQCRRGYRS